MDSKTGGARDGSASEPGATYVCSTADNLITIYSIAYDLRIMIWLAYIILSPSGSGAASAGAHCGPTTVPTPIGLHAVSKRRRRMKHVCCAPPARCTALQTINTSAFTICLSNVHFTERISLPPLLLLLVAAYVRAHFWPWTRDEPQDKHVQAVCVRPTYLGRWNYER